MPPKIDLDEEQVMELYLEGKTDQQIAKEVGCVNSYICKWRTANECPPNQGLFAWQKQIKSSEFAKIPEKYRDPKLVIA